MEYIISDIIHYKLDDLLEKIEWCENNTEKCIKIIENANNYMKQFENPYIEELIENEILNVYFNKVDYSKI